MSPDAMMAYESLTGFVFHLLPPLPVSQELLPRLLAIFSSGIIVLDIHVILISHIFHHGVLGSIFGNASLDCVGS
jgi:hypothetical protein